MTTVVAPVERTVAWRPVAVVSVVLAGALLAFADRYGYNVDELYYRMLGTRGPAWGYVDQPPLVPLLTDVSTWLSGDNLIGMRLPAIVCAAAMVVLCVLITAELGGGRSAQVLTAVCVATSALVLGVGHVFVTSTVDVAAWCAVGLFVVRALMRSDGRWWLAAGAACGVAVYAKYIILLFPITLVVALLLVGPRAPFRSRWFYAGMGLALLVGAPNFVYQLTHGLPQLDMAEVLAATDGPTNRVVLVPSLILVLGPALTPIWVAGLVSLFRNPDWKPLRAIGLAFPIGCALLLVNGGRPDYAGGFLLVLLAMGCVVVQRWLAGAAWRRVVLTAGVALSALLQALIALPILPSSTLAQAPLNNISLESVGWPELVEEVAKVHASLPPDERARAVVLTHNFGEAGAIDRYGREHGLPAVYSGHNELHVWGPPPETADVVVAVGFTDSGELERTFTECAVVAKVDNGLGVENAEQGKPISVCRGLRDSWARLWPSYRYLSG